MIAEPGRADDDDKTRRRRRSPRSGRIDVVDFFSGCGGTSQGLREAGFCIRTGIDMDADAADTFRENFPEAKFINDDIRSVPVSHLLEFSRKHRRAPVLFTACAPCQPFSRQNRERGGKDERIALLDEMHRFVRRLRPDYIFVENVPGIQNVQARSGPLGRFAKLLRSLKYDVTCGVVDFLEFGVPQTRKRFVLVASLHGAFEFPHKTHGTGLRPYSTVWEWISDLPPIEAGQSHPEVPNHRAPGLSPKNAQRIRHTPEGGDRRHWPRDLMPACHVDHDGHADVYGRLRRDRPAATLTTRCISLSNGRFGHPTQDRALSVREAACLQTFPRDFIFRGSMEGMAQQIGNAVPVLLAKRFGEKIVEHHRDHAEA